MEKEKKILPDDQTSKLSKMLTQTRVIYYFALGWAILATILFFYSLIRNDRVQKEFINQLVTTIGASISPALQHPNQQFLQDTVTSIARSGKFSLVILANPNGKVIVSTDRRFDGQTLSDITNASTVASPYSRNDRTRYDLILEEQGRTNGFMRVEIAANAN